jgi:hypothetical protein
MFEKRKNLLINPAFQLRFIAWMSAVALVVVMVFYTAHLYFFRTYLLRAKNVGLPANHIFFTFLSEQYRDMNWILLVTSIGVVLLVSTLGLVISHRIAGPLDRLRNHMTAKEDEIDLSEFQFRSADYFRELGEAYNHHLSLIKRKTTSETPVAGLDSVPTPGQVN